MTKVIFSLLILIHVIVYSQVGINTLTPSPAASLHVNAEDVNGNIRGFMPPRVTVAQRDLIPVTSSDDGMMVYVLNAENGKNCMQLYNGSINQWESVKCFAVMAFRETMGVPVGNTNVNTHHSNLGFDNSSSCTFSTTNGTDVRTTSPSTGGASGGGNIFFTNNSNRDFLVTGIDVSSYESPLTLRIQLYKSTSASNGSELTIEYYNGASWIDVTVNNLPTGIGTAVWHNVILGTSIPNTISQIRFSRSPDGTSGPQFRLDDIEIIKP